MALRIEFTENGLNIISLGINIHASGNIVLKKLSLHPGKNSIRPWFEEEYEYYFIDSVSMFIPECGLVKEIFIATDKEKIVVGIFLFLEEHSDKLTEELSKIYDSPLLKSDSFVNGSASGSKVFWKKNDIPVFLSNAVNSPYIKLTFTKTQPEEKTPGINIV